jgi:hypothetical protein
MGLFEGNELAGNTPPLRASFTPTTRPFARAQPPLIRSTPTRTALASAPIGR